MKNEFSGKDVSTLKAFEINMNSYKEGCLDTLKIVEDFISDLSKRTQIMWNEKLKQCAEEIEKQSHDK